jgi:hypothetical protein
MTFPVHLHVTIPDEGDPITHRLDGHPAPTLDDVLRILEAGARMHLQAALVNGYTIKVKAQLPGVRYE